MKKVTSPRFDLGFRIVFAVVAVALVLVMNLDEHPLGAAVITVCLSGTSAIFCWAFYRENRQQIATNRWDVQGDPLDGGA